MLLKLVRTFLPLVLGVVLLRDSCFGVLPEDSLADKVRKWIWPLLLVLIGLAWEFSTKSSNATVDIGFVVLIGAVYWWYWLWCTNGITEQTKSGLFLVVLIAATLVWTTAKTTPRASLLLLPLLAWIMFVEHLPAVPRIIRLPFISVELPHIQDGSIAWTGEK